MLKVFCARSMHVAVTALVRPFSVRTGETPEIVFEPMGALQARLAAGERADVLILAASAIDALEQADALVPGSRLDLARAPIGVAVATDAPIPDISTPHAFKAALGAAHRIALSDPAVGGSAGTYLRDLFGRIGMADTVAAKTVPQRSGVAAADCVGRRDADLALSFIPELMQGKGARVVGPLPPPFDHATAYAVALSAQSQKQETGRALIAALTASDAGAAWSSAGFEYLRR